MSYKITSLLQLVKHCDLNASKVKDNFIISAKRIPKFSYNILYETTKMLMEGSDIEDVINLLQESEKRRDVLAIYLNAVDILQDFSKIAAPEKIFRRRNQFYPISSELSVPFKNPLIYRSNNQWFLPIFCFWKNHSLYELDRLPLLFTILDDIRLNDADLEGIALQFVDISARKSNSQRELRLLDGEKIPRLTAEKKKAMLNDCVQGYLEAQQFLEKAASLEANTHATQPQIQLGLFDIKPE